MDLSDELMAHVLRLARLELDPAEVDAVKGDLHALLAYVDQLRSVDVAGLEPLVRPLPPHDTRRPDHPTTPLPQADALRLAPASQDGFVRVPRTVDEA